jgi:hypothetical protein
VIVWLLFSWRNVGHAMPKYAIWHISLSWSHLKNGRCRTDFLVNTPIPNRKIDPKISHKMFPSLHILTRVWETTGKLTKVILPIFPISLNHCSTKDCLLIPTPFYCHFLKFIIFLQKAYKLPCFAYFFTSWGRSSTYKILIQLCTFLLLVCLMLVCELPLPHGSSQL